jgi:DNA repair photolyase
MFDPWKGKLCTCNKKYSLSPYTGCEHRCRYCYITTYIPRAFECRPKHNFIKQVSKELERADPKYPISIANSSDPYPPIELDLGLTRKLLKQFQNHNFKILLVTKSDIVRRDIDLLKRLNVVVTVTITTHDSALAAKLEPNAPSPLARIEAVQSLIENGIGCMVRIDPIIPGVNENPIELVQKLCAIGLTSLTSSTYKARPDSLKRMISCFPEHKIIFEELYKKNPEFINRSRYLPQGKRYQLMCNIKKLADEYDIEFGLCREGFPALQTAKSCDGTHLLR